MLAKKTHEVEQLAALVCSVASAAGCSRVLDIGCGKGSLASQLAVVGGLHVVGLEAQEAMSLTAAKVALKAAKSATSLPSGGSLRLWHRTVAADEHAPQFVEDICAEAWPRGMGGRGGGGGKVDSDEDIDDGVLLCALHACGDLSSTITRSFANSPRCRAIVLIPCCYNLLTVSGDPCGAEHTPMKCEPCEISPSEISPSASPADDVPVDMNHHPVAAVGPAAAAAVAVASVVRTAHVPTARVPTARVPPVAKAAAATNGFPLSSCVRSTGLVLTRDARMASVQREAASLAPSWLEEAPRTDVAGRASGRRSLM